MMTLDEALQTVAEDSTCCVTAILVHRTEQGLETALGFKLKEQEWATPGGKCDGGETLEVALRRELSEETGVTQITITEYCGSVKGTSQAVALHVFVAFTEQKLKNPEPETFREWKWFSFADLPDNFRNTNLKAITEEKGRSL